MSIYGAHCLADSERSRRGVQPTQNLRNAHFAECRRLSFRRPRVGRRCCSQSSASAARSTVHFFSRAFSHLPSRLPPFAGSARTSPRVKREPKRFWDSSVADFSACRSSRESFLPGDQRCNLVMIRKQIGGITENRECARGAENVRIGAAAGEPDCL